ncbi:MAG: class I SAM-dependent RNA methyltransferase [Clostridiales bacterium]|nr:class I SAM-dependent RNA methyltransferase [Clostridiales bacterium]
MEIFNCYATAAFGLEGLVAGELRAMNLPDVRAENGGVRFSAAMEQVFESNLSLRCSDRVMIILAEGKCLSFEELFQLVLSVPWEKYMSGTESIDISAKCARSRLMSPRDCQSITKKAVIERLKKKTGRKVFPENGPSFPVLVSIHSDAVKILLNTSGDALSRRGYRTWNGEAPLRETLAAALVDLSPWKSGMPLYDPCCGTGTILIEAAWKAANRAPGLTRSFAMERFSFADAAAFSALRKRKEQECDFSRIRGIGGGDIDPEAIRLAELHLKQSGTSGLIPLRNEPFRQASMTEAHGVFICNPPYGERLSDRENCRKLYRELREMWARHPGWSFCAISSDPAFERAFGKKADRRRRIYNGRLECNYYVYYGSGKTESD